MFNILFILRVKIFETLERNFLLIDVKVRSAMSMVGMNIFAF